MTRPTPYTCEQVFARLDGYLDRALAADELERVLEHLETCAVCAGEYRFEEGVLDEVRAKLGRIRGPEGLMERIAAALREPGDPGD